MRKCPKCGSEDTRIFRQGSLGYIVCNKCGYDEYHDILSVFPESRSSQKAKGQFSPYKAGRKIK